MAMRRNAPPPRWAAALGGVLVALALALPARAQQAGTVTGQVKDRTTGEPLNGVQMSITGTALGSLSDARGRYVISNVPAGQHTVEAVYIGYRTEQVTVSVAAGQTATADFELGVSAVSLDEVVVTGTAGGAERKQLGASVASVDVSRVQENIPVSDVGSILQARVAGVRSIAVVGGAGAGRKLQIRGTTSIGQIGQRPVVYIDGVKVDNHTGEWASDLNGAACCSFSGGAGEDRLSDLNPNDIERIEVIKGAAAGTLYGSEAANGVIQIFTKKGRNESAARWTAEVTGGFSRYRANFQTKLYPNFNGPDGFQAQDANDLIGNGPYQSYNVSVQGGGNSVTYYASGGYTDEEGSIQPNYAKRGNVRVNLHWLAGDKLSFDLTSAFTRSRVEDLQSGNNWTALLGNALLGNPKQATAEKPFGEPWVAVSAIQDIQTTNDANRWTGGLALNFNPTDKFTNRVQLGLDAVNEEKLRLMPWGYPYVYVPEGEKDLGYRNKRLFTLDYLGTLSFDLAQGVGNTFSFGANGTFDNERRNLAIGVGFAGPGVTTVDGGTNTFGSEWFQEEVQVGFFGQNRVSYKDRLFLTTGVRFDGNSAFGDSYGFQIYPNVQLSYDIAREGFLPEAISSLRLRGSVGAAGRAPGAFDKFRTYSPLTALDDEAAIQASDPGNEDLKPERSLEIEGGFELGILNDRVGLDVSVYRQKTSDALIRVTTPPSQTFGSSPLANIGSLKNIGWEATLRATPYESSALRWQTDVRLDGNKNTVLDLGVDADGNPIDTRSVGGIGRVRVGFPVNGIWARQPVPGSYDPATMKWERSDTLLYIGSIPSTFNASWSNELTFGAFRLYGLVSMERGGHFSNSDRPYRFRQGAGDEYLSTLDADGNPTAITDSIFNYWQLFSAYDKTDNVRLREVSVTYNLPASLMQSLGLGRTSITAAGKNVQWWDDCHCLDPSMDYRGGASFGSSGFLAMPAPRQFLVTVRTSF